MSGVNNDKVNSVNNNMVSIDGSQINPIINKSQTNSVSVTQQIGIPIFVPHQPP